MSRKLLGSCLLATPKEGAERSWKAWWIAGDLNFFILWRHRWNDGIGNYMKCSQSDTYLQTNHDRYRGGWGGIRLEPCQPRLLELLNRFSEGL